MKDPKKLAWVYLVVGVLAVALSLYYMTIDTSVLDWIIFGMGAVAIFRGVQQFLQLRGEKKPPKQG